MKTIIKLILSISIFSTLLFSENINETKTDIYFGNGVWNQAEDAEKSRKELEENFIIPYIIKNDPKLQTKYGEVKIQYNWSHGTMLDVIETFYQLKEAGQIGETMFFIFMDELMASRASDITNTDIIAVREQILNMIVSTEEAEVNAMLTKYYEKSFKFSHRVLLVSHSQGNMFANRVYDAISPTKYQNYFANLQIASPASSVHAKIGDYVTGFVDPIINPIPGSMESNSILNLPGGHAFVEAYLASGDTSTRIIQKMQTLLKDLDDVKSQWDVEEELRKGTKDYKVTLKHSFDASITSMDGIEVYPFNLEKKLYNVTDNTGGNGWVKASFGGEEVFDSWDGQEVDENYMINNQKKEILSILKEISFFVNLSFTFNIHTGNNSYHYGTSTQHIADDVNCSFSTTGSGRTVYSPFVDSGEETNLAWLSTLRDDYEFYYNRGFKFHKDVECIIVDNGYEVSEVESIMKRGEETRTVVDNTSTKKSYLLKQEYIITPK